MVHWHALSNYSQNRTHQPALALALSRSPKARAHSSFYSNLVSVSSSSSFASFFSLIFHFLRHARRCAPDAASRGSQPKINSLSCQYFCSIPPDIVSFDKAETFRKRNSAAINRNGQPWLPYLSFCDHNHTTRPARESHLFHPNLRLSRRWRAPRKEDGQTRARVSDRNSLRAKKTKRQRKTTRLHENEKADIVTGVLLSRSSTWREAGRPACVLDFHLFHPFLFFRHPGATSFVSHEHKQHQRAAFTRLLISSRATPGSRRPMLYEDANHLRSHSHHVILFRDAEESGRLIDNTSV